MALLCRVTLMYINHYGFVEPAALPHGSVAHRRRAGDHNAPG
jgi:hypothetical protein